MNATDDWYEIEQINDYTYRIAEGVIFNSFLFEGADRALLVDAGAGIGDLRGMVDQLVDTPVTLLLTHSHWDHIGGAHAFDDVRIHEHERHPDGQVTEDVVLKNSSYGPTDFVAEWQAGGKSLPDAFDPESFEIPPVTGVEPFHPGTEIDLGGRSLETYHLPGHSPGQIGVLDRDACILYGADVIHRDHGLYIHFTGCDVEAYIETFERVRELRESNAFDRLYIAHDRPLDGEGLLLIDEFIDGLRSIVAGNLDYEIVDPGSGPARQYEIAGKHVLTPSNTTD